MDQKTFKQILDRAKQDSQFFHSLVFDPEKAIADLHELDRSAKGALISVNPEEVIARLIGRTSWCDVTCTSSCGVTCSGSSCGYTTNLVDRIRPTGIAAGCDVTCTSSCGATCGTSCGYTTNREVRFSDPGFAR